MVGELNRSLEAVKEDVQRLQDWLEKQPHLPKDIDDEVLTAFVCGTKTLEDAKGKLDNYYSARVRSPETYNIEGREAALTDCRNSKYGTRMFFLPKPTPDGNLVMMIIPTEDFENKFYHPPEFSRFFMLLDLAMYSWPQAAGFYFLVDTRHVTTSSMTKISPSLIATGSRVLSNSYPFKIKGIFFKNAPSFAEFFVNTLIKPFMKEKIFNRIKISTEEVSSCKEFIPLEMFPSDFGGMEKSSQELDDLGLEHCEKNKDWLKKICLQSTDENKRPSDKAATYGIDGTFRKLTVD